MGWSTRFQNNDPSYLEPRISNNESSLAQSAQQLQAEKINVMYPPSPMVGAKGDGTTDDTTSIQNIINYAVPKGIRVYFPTPSSFYKITSALTVPQGSAFLIEGASRGSVTIKQFTDNTPIFKFIGNLTHSWIIKELCFDYANHQPNTNTLAIPIYFELPGGASGNGGGMFNFVIERCFFNGGYYGVMQTQTSEQLPLWGVHIKDCTFGGYLSGGAVYINPVPAIGQPIINLDNVYIDASNMTKNIIAVYNSDTVLLKSVEINGGTYSSGVASQINIQTCQNVTLLNTRCETATVNGTLSVWDFANSYVNVIGCSQSLILNANATATGVNAGSGGRASVHGFNFGASSVGSGATGYAVAADDIIVLDNVNVPTAGLSKYKTFGIQPRLDMAKVQPNFTKVQGDANVTLTSTDFPLQYFNTALTANRTVTLPNSGLYDGMTFTIVKYNTSAYTLTINDPMSAKNITIPASTKASVTYRAVGTAEWLPIQYSTFS